MRTCPPSWFRLQLLSRGALDIAGVEIGQTQCTLRDSISVKTGLLRPGGRGPWPHECVDTV